MGVLAVSLLGGGAGVVVGGFGLLVLAMGLGLWLIVRRLQALPLRAGHQTAQAEQAAAPQASSASRPGTAAAVQHRRPRRRGASAGDPGPDSVPAVLPSRLPPIQMAASPSPVQVEISAHLRRLAEARAARLQAGRRALAPASMAAPHATVRAAAGPEGPLAGESSGPAWSSITLADTAPRALVTDRPPVRVPADPMVSTAVLPSGDRPSPTVLVADDARIVRVKLARLLGPRGWVVHEAADGATALARLRGAKPDLLITDVDMPGLDGFALTRAIRSDPVLADLPVVMVTGDDDRHREEATRAGVSVLLGKPYGEAALIAHIGRLCPGAAAARPPAPASAMVRIVATGVATPGGEPGRHAGLPPAGMPGQLRPVLSLGR